MKKILYVLIPLALVVFVAFRLRSNKTVSEQRVYRYDKAQAIFVQADTLRPEEVAGDHFFTGSFEPNRETRVSADVQGKIDVIYVDAGSRVKKGQPLVQLDNAMLKLQLQSVEVQIQGLEADVQRYSVLVKADAIQGVQLEKAELGLRSALVQRNTLLEQIERTTVRAPFNGIVTAKLTEVGAFAAPGVPLIQLTDIAELKFTVNIPETDLALFESNTATDVVADVYPELKLPGRVDMIGSKGSLANTFPVQILVTNTRDLKIKSGMFGKLFMKQAQQDKRIIIPASAVAGSAIQPQVYVISNGKAVLRNISIAMRYGNKAVVGGGLQDGDILVTGGFINLFDGANVEVRN